MSQIATHSSTRRITRWTIVAAALASLLIAASGAAASQDLRSPDARGAASQDLRSPDARAGVAVPAQATVQDLRSPDAADAARLVPAAPVQAQPSTGSDWTYLALAVLLSLTLGGAALVAQRRRSRVMPIGR